ncbi:MAG: HipA domain-containing protein [Puniceicoccales bacterium]|jgi:hypothetical protein|nr:HipA domain-containing protein [Puniceicoccales bacterium]
MNDNQELYPITHIKLEWVLGREAMGSKKKFWYRENNDADQWLFKYLQKNEHTGELAGQHWAEKIAEQVAALLGTDFAKVELAVFEGDKGSTTCSFTNENRILLHGNEILPIAFPTYDKQAKFKHKSHTLENIWTAMDKVLGNTSFGYKAILSEYLVLDALIGNVDRHHENWGLLYEELDDGDWDVFLAPSFDHASSLGRELQDVRREQIRCSQEGLARYVNNGHGGIYWATEEKHAPSPLELIRRAAATYPELLQPALAKASAINPDHFTQIIARIPEGWMSTAARNFALALLRYNQQQLASLPL